ncbi:MAG TPA: energy-coupling factor transporter ATPase [Candidatus Aphodomonas merdavium]|nr:energy-coupling factor transporter ATPase [Candidatus Aphodomonas merdavium]
MSIALERLTYTYMPDSPFAATAVRDVSFTVQDGDFFALIGHTGSGKTTVAMHMNALLRPVSGRVLVDGQDIFEKGVDRRDVRRRVGMVFQYPEYQLFEESVKKDVMFGPKNLGLSQEECEQRAEEALYRVGLDAAQIGERSPFELSGGQMRRVAIAGVLAMRPGTLVLDEPAAGLDPAGRRDMLNLVRALHEEGTTIVMVSHSMEDVANYATHIAVLDHGTLAMEGTPREVFAQGKRLTEIGLDVPVAVQMADALRERGYTPPQGLCRMDELQAWLLAHLERRNGAE